MRMAPSDWIAVAALGMSLIALMVAGVSARYAGRSAHASERSATASELAAQAASDIAGLERERRHEELKPVFRVQSDASIDIQGLTYAGMWVCLEGPHDLDEIRVRFEPPTVGEPHEVWRVLVGSQNYGLRPGEEMQYGFPLRCGERFRVLFERNAVSSGRNPVRLRCECKREGHPPWVTTAEGRTPG